MEFTKEDVVAPRPAGPSLLSGYITYVGVQDEAVGACDACLSSSGGK